MLYTGQKLNGEKIIALLISLLEKQEGVTIKYELGKKEEKKAV